MATKILFATIQQAVGDLRLGAAGISHHHADDTRLRRDPALLRIGRKAGMCKSDQPPIIVSQHQAVVVEIELGKDELLKQVGRYRLNESRLSGAPQSPTSTGGSKLRNGRYVNMHNYSSENRRDGKLSLPA